MRRFKALRDQFSRAAWAVALAVAASGCASRWSPPSEPWPAVEDGRVLLTEHYRLHTNVADAEFRRELARTMEQSHALYERLAPTAGAGEPLEGFVFAYRDEWARHTRDTTGPMATVYLQIHRGGYAHDESFATFFFGTPQTLTAARHEGWHQYVAASFERRPPPFVEEGVATLFEEGFESNRLASPRSNPRRHAKIVAAVRRQRLWPLETLLTMNAGHVVGQDGPQVETFYAQAHALARMLVSDKRYRDGFRRLLAAYADGSAGREADAALFERHLGVPLRRLSSDFEAYQHRLAGEG